MRCLQILEEKREYRAKTPAFKYRTHSQLSSAVYTSKTSLRMFDGSGYAHDFDVKDEEAFDEITDLLSGASWVDAATRFLVVEMTVYSPATDLVATVFFMVRCVTCAACSVLWYTSARRQRARRPSCELLPQRPCVLEHAHPRAWRAQGGRR